jgi:hypothetical protein
MRRFLLLASALCLSACVSSLTVKPMVETVPSCAARVELQPLGGMGKHQTCQAPCSVEIAPRTRYTLTLRAPGYYPASMALDWGIAARSGQKVVVPLKAIGEAAGAAGH